MLIRAASGMRSVPTSAQASKRLGWQLTKFNRKLDNVCDKLDRLGVRGLRGGPGKLASNRRARLVEHAVFSRLVTSEDLPLLDQSQEEEIGRASCRERVWVAGVGVVGTWRCGERDGVS